MPIERIRLLMSEVNKFMAPHGFACTMIQEVVGSPHIGT